MVKRRGALLGTLCWVAVAVGAQELPAQLTGRLDSAFVWTQNQGVGLSTGRLGLTAGTADVKSEVRVDLTNTPSPTLDLNRAWIKFRVPGLRVTTGLGRLAWGTGGYLVPGDLMFDSTGTVDWTADELRSQGAWLADAWVPLGDEAFVETSALADTVGGRVSAAPWGVTVEAAGAWKPKVATGKAALSMQVHEGVDWYATVREDFPGGWQEAGGLFGLGTLAEGVTLSTRNEVAHQEGGSTNKVFSYSDLTVVLDGVVTLTARALYTPATQPWTALAEVRWAPLQNLGLSVQAGVTQPSSLRVGCTALW